MKLFFIFLILSLSNISIAASQNDCLCCIEFYYLEPRRGGILNKVERKFINDTLLLVEYLAPPSNRHIYTDTFKIVDGVFYLKFKGTFYRYFSKKDFDLGLPMRRYTFSTLNQKASSVSYYPVEKFNTDSFTVYTFRFVEHDLRGRDVTYSYQRVYFAPEVGIIRAETFDSEPRYMDSYHIIKYQESEGCEAYFKRVLGNSKDN